MEHISVPTFRGSIWKSWRENPSSWQCLVVPRTRILSHYLTRIKLHRLWNSKRSVQLYCFETDVRDSDIEVCQRSWLRNLQNRRNFKKHKKGTKTDEELTAEEEQETPFSLVTHVNNILHSIFPNVEVYINNQQIYNSNWLSGYKSFVSYHFKMPSLTTMEFCTAMGTTMKIILIRVWKRLCLNHFSQGEWKCWAVPMAFRCIVKRGLTFSPVLNC